MGIDPFEEKKESVKIIKINITDNGCYVDESDFKEYGEGLIFMAVSDCLSRMQAARAAYTIMSQK